MNHPSQCLWLQWVNQDLVWLVEVLIVFGTMPQLLDLSFQSTSTTTCLDCSKSGQVFFLKRGAIAEGQRLKRGSNSDFETLKFESKQFETKSPDRQDQCAGDPERAGGLQETRSGHNMWRTSLNRDHHGASIGIVTMGEVTDQWGWVPADLDQRKLCRFEFSLLLRLSFLP